MKLPVVNLQDKPKKGSTASTSTRPVRSMSITSSTSETNNPEEVASPPPATAAQPAANAQNAVNAKKKAQPTQQAVKRKQADTTTPPTNNDLDGDSGKLEGLDFSD